ncbi:crotonyl-CoA carboxylase/reductase [Kitasatospora sp. MMS16-BH015]|uniref:crotonyl-CoA carboxylase/reductase n=1 Tax=Kitasatospora sp. MMS16-BH015 TaxID=2018025 RepID=UPI000CA1ADD4|nr:crotonyl-CoA carboxylase/reductase [Kitasatospora sp. MMS16-BH015]AUG75715.1 crotonyl-CoA carboxylase/reductase [Kitasatospora sp. MMS16-BH015]
MPSLIEAVRAGGDPAELLACPVPESYRAVHLRRADEKLFGAEPDRDVRRTLHLGEVPMPELAPDEVLIAVMASAVNYNTVWSAMYRPVSTFRFLDRFARQGRWPARHGLDHQVVGSDAAGVVVRVGAAVRHWHPGDRVVVNPPYIDEQDPVAQQDGMLTGGMLAWGFETNFGAFGDFCVARATQLVRKPPHLSWEEAACNTLCLGTAYRMLISDRGARIKMGDVVLIWGAAGGLGSYAVQLVRQAGGTAVGVVGSPDKAELLQRLGCQMVVDRSSIGLGPEGEGGQVPWRALGSAIRKELGEDPHVVFEHVGRATFETSVNVVRRGGTVVTCGSSSGYQHSYDNRYLWMKLKRVIGSHGASAHEAWEATRLLSLGLVVPTLSTVYPLDRAAEATRSVQLNAHEGKVGLLGLATEEGQGIEDPVLRDRIGEQRLRLFRDHAATRPTRPDTPAPTSAAGR